MKAEEKLTLQNLLEKIKIIDYKFSLLKQDDRFNVFSLLRDPGDEVHLHSRFIGELLNPVGSHNCGDIFLKLFIGQLFKNQESVDTSKTKVFVEEHIGAISADYSRGGRIDIIIKDYDSKNIIIENKIYADDQPKQLLRYFNYDPNAIIIYLTLFGEEPSDKSLGIDSKVKATDIPLKRKEINLFSYRENILNWLNQCVEKASTKPALRETILQYIKLIDKLTGNMTSIAERLELFHLLGR